MKHNNPFKMIGPWIGAIFYLVWMLLSFNDSFRYSIITTAVWFPFGNLAYLFAIDPKIVYIGIALQVVLGFLLGWFVQSLIRKVSK
jgi:hypothetical protein